MERQNEEDKDDIYGTNRRGIWCRIQIRGKGITEIAQYVPLAGVSRYNRPNFAPKGRSMKYPVLGVVVSGSKWYWRAWDSASASGKLTRNRCTVRQFEVDEILSRGMESRWPRWKNLTIDVEFCWPVENGWLFGLIFVDHFFASFGASSTMEKTHIQKDWEQRVSESSRIHPKKHHSKNKTKNVEYRKFIIWRYWTAFLRCSNNTDWLHIQEIIENVTVNIKKIVEFLNKFGTFLLLIALTRFRQLDPLQARQNQREVDAVGETDGVPRKCGQDDLPRTTMKPPHTIIFTPIILGP